MIVLELAAAFPDLAEALTAMAARVVDLLPLTRANRHHRDQRGNWSIKAVLPTIAAEMITPRLHRRTAHCAECGVTRLLRAGHRSDDRACAAVVQRIGDKRHEHLAVI